LVNTQPGLYFLTIIDGSKEKSKDTDSVVYIIFSGLKYVKNQTIVIIDLNRKGKHDSILFIFH
jgi:hypothetical protein